MGNIFPCLFHFWWLQWFLGLCSIAQISASIFLWAFPLCLSLLLEIYYPSWAHLNPEWPHIEISNFIISAKFIFPNKIMYIFSRGFFFFEEAMWSSYNLPRLFKCLYFLPYSTWKDNHFSFAHLNYFSTQYTYKLVLFKMV